MTSLPVRLGGIFGLSALFIFSIAPVSAQQPTGALSEVVELPPVTVTDSQILPLPESWRYAEIPGFEILSNASDTNAQRLIRDFERFRMGLGVVWPMPSKPALPTSIILCGRGGKFDKFLPKGDSRVEQTTASLFLTDKERSAIVIDFESRVLDIASPDQADTTSGVDPGRLNVEHDKQLYREYFRSIMSRTNPRLPAWLEEGLAQIVMRMEVRKNDIAFGELQAPVSAAAGAAAAANAAAIAEGEEDPELGTAPADDADFNVALARRRLLPMGKLFAVTHDSPEARNPLGNNIWAKQAYAFVHMCLYGENKQYQQAFANFVMRSTKEPVTEALFQECFKMNYKKMGNTLRSYISVTAYQPEIRVAKRGKGLPDMAKVEFRDATQSEVGRIKGEALELAGKRDEARVELIAPYVRGERDPQLLAALGLHELTTQPDRAKKFLEAAVVGKTPRPRAYLELARMRLAEATAKGTPSISPESTARIMAPLHAGAMLSPPNQEIFRMIGDVLGRSEAQPTDQDLALMMRGVSLFYTDLKIVYQAAAFHAAAGRTKELESLTQHAFKYISDPAGRARFEKLKELVPVGR